MQISAAKSLYIRKALCFLTVSTPQSSTISCELISWQLAAFALYMRLPLSRFRELSQRNNNTEICV